MNAHLRCCVAASAFVAVAAGCSSPPPASNRGTRIDPTVTTPSERGVREMRTAGWIEFSDLCAEQLMADLQHLPEITGSPRRATIMLGDIVNKTQVVSSTEFEQFRSRFQGLLVGARDFSDVAVFRAGRARMEDIRRRETGEAGAPAPVDPGHAYALNGEMYATHRTDKVIYSLTLQLVSFGSGNVVWQNRPYDLAQYVTR